MRMFIGLNDEIQSIDKQENWIKYRYGKGWTNWVDIRE